jgi:hypothetical protein
MRPSTLKFLRLTQYYHINVAIASGNTPRSLRSINFPTYHSQSASNL